MKVCVATLSLLLLPSVAAQLPTYSPTIWKESNSTQEDESASMITESGETKAPPTNAPGPSWGDDSSGEDSSSSSFVGDRPTPVPSPYTDGATPIPSSGAYSSASGPYDDSISTGNSSPTVDEYATSSNAFPTDHPKTAPAEPSSFVTVEEISIFPTAGGDDDWYSYSAASVSTSESSSEITNTTHSAEEDGSREPVVAAAQSAEGDVNGSAAHGAFSLLVLGLSSIIIGMN